jgi:hypothetical protein
MSRSLLPPHTRSVKMESRTPRTAIFDPLLICLEGFQDAQKVDVLFVCVRLSSADSLALLPELLPQFHYGKSITAVFGIESGFSLGAEGGTRPLPSARVHRRAPSALSPLFLSTNVYHFPLLSAGYGVRKGVSQEYSSFPPGCRQRTWKPMQSTVMVGWTFSSPH